MASNSTGSVRTSTEKRTVTVQRTETVPASARVRHFDELDEHTKQLLADFDAGEALVPITGRVTDDVRDGDVVVFTDYYQFDVQ